MPRPQIVGLIVRQIDMNHTGVTNKGRRSNKDYRITISIDGGQHHLYTEYGPAGRLQNGEEHALDAPSAAIANRRADELCEAKKNQRDSYRATSDQHFRPAPTTAPIPATPPAATSHPASPRRQIKSIESLSAASRRAISSIF